MEPPCSALGSLRWSAEPELGQQESAGGSGKGLKEVSAGRGHYGEKPWPARSAGLQLMPGSAAGGGLQLPSAGPLRECGLGRLARLGLLLCRFWQKISDTECAQRALLQPTLTCLLLADEAEVGEWPGWQGPFPW